MIPPNRSRRAVTLFWHPYRRFTWDNVHAHVPVKSGVYKLAVHTTDGKLSVLYVGQGIDLDGRLKDHLSQQEPNLCLRTWIRQYQCSFSISLVSLAQNRDAAERALYWHFRPSCNERVPTGPDYFVTPLTTR